MENKPCHTGIPHLASLDRREKAIDGETWNWIRNSPSCLPLAAHSDQFMKEMSHARSGCVGTEIVIRAENKHDKCFFPDQHNQLRARLWGISQKIWLSPPAHASPPAKKKSEVAQENYWLLVRKMEHIRVRGFVDVPYLAQILKM